MEPTACPPEFCCPACGRTRQLSAAVAPASCACLLCYGCLEAAVAAALRDSHPPTGPDGPLARRYRPGRGARFLAEDGSSGRGEIAKVRWDGPMPMIGLRASDTRDGSEADLLWVPPSAVSLDEEDDNENDSIGARLPAMRCPSCAAHLSEVDAAAAAPDAFRAFCEAMSEAALTGANFIRCPNPDCGAVIERPAQDSIPQRDDCPASTSFDAPFRIRCAMCARDFCGTCLATPFHGGMTCEENGAPDCRFCGGKATPKSSAKTAKELRASAERLGADTSWCIEKGDLHHVWRLASGVCGDAGCLRKLAESCTRDLPCGHSCCGVRGEVACPRCVCSPCGGGSGEAEECQICWEPLPRGPCLELRCGHILHLDCLRGRLAAGYPGPEISFNFLACPLCGSVEGRMGNVQVALSAVHMDHPALHRELEPWLALREEVGRLAKRRLKAMGLLATAPELRPGGSHDGRPVDFALKQFLYFLCFKCRRPYFGGVKDCQRGAGQEYRPEELRCGSCAALMAGEHCRLHGTEAIEWKCRYCCSTACWFCWGTTHLCDACHSNVAALQLQQCASPDTCPLRIRHPPPGEEFCLGCALCRYGDALPKS